MAMQVRTLKLSLINDAGKKKAYNFKYIKSDISKQDIQNLIDAMCETNGMYAFGPTGVNTAKVVSQDTTEYDVT